MHHLIRSFATTILLAAATPLVGCGSISTAMTAEIVSNGTATQARSSATYSILDLGPGHPILDQHQAVTNVDNVQVLDDRHVLAGGATVTIEFQGPDTTFGAGATKTWVGVYNAMYTSDPASGGTRLIGAIGGIPTFTSTTAGSIAIDPSGLAAGSYWLRFKTQLADGSWEVAEGALLVH